MISLVCTVIKNTKTCGNQKDGIIGNSEGKYKICFQPAQEQQMADKNILEFIKKKKKCILRNWNQFNKEVKCK